MLTATSPHETLAASAHVNTALTSQTSGGLAAWCVSFTLKAQRRTIHTDTDHTNTDTHRSVAAGGF